MMLKLKEWIAKVSNSLAMSSATCTKASGWVNYDGTTDPKVYKRGNVCTFSWAAKPNTTSIAIDGNYRLICTIPVGYRPPAQIFSIQQGSSTSIYLLIVNPGGEVYVARMRENAQANGAYMNAGTSNGYTWFPIAITYVVA